MLLDRYYRYGHGFNKIVYTGFDDGIRRVRENTHTDTDGTSGYLVNRERVHESEFLLYNDEKEIRLRDIDKGEVSISKIEKWKREVVNRQVDFKRKLRLMDPKVYHSLITFVVFSKFGDRPSDNFLTKLGIICELHRRFNYNYKHKYLKIYQDKIYNKVKTKII